MPILRTMKRNETPEEIVRRLDPEIDRIVGLITSSAGGGRVMALVASRDRVAPVRSELERFGVPRTLLDVDFVGDWLIPYPNDDERLMRWIEERGGGEE